MTITRVQGANTVVYTLVTAVLLKRVPYRETQTQKDPASAAHSARRLVWSVDNDQPIWKVHTLHR